MSQLKFILIAGSVLAIGVRAHAQSIGPSAIDAAGASASVAGNTYEYAIGQVVAGATFTSATLVITPGVLQPVNATGIKGQEISAGGLQVYPGPVETTLFLQPAFGGNGILQYRLYDAAGKLVIDKESKLLSGNERQTVDVAQLASGQYMLQVNWMQAGTMYTSGYKIQKLK